jgi:hypothetical protein
MNDSGRLVRSRFTPDAGIAAWWEAATTGKIPRAELERAQILFSHEYVERSLMRSGLPYRFFGSDGIELPGGAHNLAPLIPNLDPGTALYSIPGQGPWTLWNE